MKYQVIVESLNYIGNVSERQVIGELISISWAETFAESVREFLKEGIEFGLVRVVIEKKEEEL